MSGTGAGAAPGMSVHRVRPDDWRRVRELRLEALRDPVASIAFLETVDDALARPDAQWQERAARLATADDAVQFLAELDGRLVGALTVFVRAAGEADYFRRVPERDLPTVVGVFVADGARGSGAIDALVAAAADWARSAGHAELTLDVHERNTRAIAAYRRNGFLVTSGFAGHDGVELGMTRGLV